MARDPRSKDRRESEDSLPEEELPLLYPEDDEEVAAAPVEEIYDPFAEELPSNVPDAPERRPTSPPAPGHRPDSGADKPSGREGEKLYRLLDMQGTQGKATSGARSDPVSPEDSAPDRRNRPSPPRSDSSASQSAGSVFEPASGAPAAPPSGSRPPVRPSRPKRTRPQPAPTPQRQDQPAESVFQPRTADRARSEPDRTGELPEDPRDLPKVKPPYERAREAGPVVTTVAILLAVSVAIMLTGGTIGALVMLAGLAWGVYRLCLILPAPVRVTPEQAVREFYDAFCHRLPNYRRMYLLLSVPAKRDKEISSYRAFCAYWRWRQAQVVGKSYFGAAGFEVERFEAKYNSQRTFAAVSFTLLLHRRGNPHDAVLIRPVSTTVVKGKDGSWYLNEGTLP